MMKSGYRRAHCANTFVLTTDWTNKTGQALSPPTNQSQRLYKEAYEYCTTNWCIRDAAESLFTYEEGSSFDEFSECDAPFTSGVDLGTATSAIAELCGANEACLVDGIIGGTGDAQNSLEEQAAVSNAATLSRFRFAPSTIQVNASYNVNVTVDLGAIVGDIQSFNIYRLNSSSLEVGDMAVIGLQDVGSGIGEDFEANDGVFSNIIALRSNFVGESFGFRAIPVINGTENSTSEYAFSSLNAIQSYSIESGIGEGGGEQNQNGTIVEDSIADLVLFVQYTWPSDQRDLDTATTFLTATVGFSCGTGTQYIGFSGDDTSTGGSETITVRLGESFADSQWNEAVTISMAAGWFNNIGSGPASVSVYTEKPVNGVIVRSETVSIVVNPGSQSGCASTAVGEVQVTVGDTVNIILVAV